VETTQQFAAVTLAPRFGLYWVPTASARVSAGCTHRGANPGIAPDGAQFPQSIVGGLMTACGGLAATSFSSNSRFTAR
jgi:hypothetical protein